MTSPHRALFSSEKDHRLPTCSSCREVGHNSQYCITQWQLREDNLPLHHKTTDLKSFAQAFAMLKGKPYSILELLHDKYVVLEEDKEKLLELIEGRHTLPPSAGQMKRHKTIKDIRQELFAGIHMYKVFPNHIHCCLIFAAAVESNNFAPYNICTCR